MAFLVEQHPEGSCLQQELVNLGQIVPADLAHATDVVHLGRDQSLRAAILGLQTLDAGLVASGIGLHAAEPGCLNVVGQVHGGLQKDEFNRDRLTNAVYKRDVRVSPSHVGLDGAIELDAAPLLHELLVGVVSLVHLIGHDVPGRGESEVVGILLIGITPGSVTLIVVRSSSLFRSRVALVKGACQRLLYLCHPVKEIQHVRARWGINVGAKTVMAKAVALQCPGCTSQSREGMPRVDMLR